MAALVRADELASFAAIPAPTGSERERRTWIEHRLREAPGERRVDDVGNLIWRLRDGPTTLLLMAHLDTVFAFDVHVAPRRVGDELIGPSVGDNAAAVMATVWALEAMASAPSGLTVAFTVGEEGLGNLRGARHACAQLAPQMAIALEGHGLDKIVTEHVGSVRAQLVIDGPGGHSWWDRETPSAVHELVDICGRVAALRGNVGVISGGGQINAIAAHAEALVERRALAEPEIEAFEEFVAALTVPPPLSLAREIVGRRPAGQISRSHPLVDGVLAVRRELGLDPRFGDGSTDANAAAALGIPAVALGCTRGSGMHTPGERIGLSALELGCRQIAAVVARVLSR
ncbi:MAG: M20/M25/M40 family metallo-hydrolase [Solirubrobacteraceae bacterium]